MSLLLVLMTQLTMTTAYKTTTIIETNNINDFHYTFPNGTSLHYSLFVDSYEDTLLMFIISYFSAAIFTMLFISHIVNKTNSYMYITDSDTEGDRDSDNDNDNDTDDEDDDINYEQQHFDALEALTDRALTPEELKELVSGQYVTEETPKGVVVMSYNVDAGSFEYYTDKFADMSYETLDTVARMFTVVYDCKQICVNYRAEVENGKTKMLSDIEYDTLMKENKEKMIQEREKGSVFASFKSYNKKTGNNVSKKYFVMTENANRFKYKGKLSDYQKLIDKPRVDEESSSKKISYAEYKRSVSDDKRSVSDDKRSVSDDKRSVSDDKRSSTE